MTYGLLLSAIDAVAHIAVPVFFTEPKWNVDRASIVNSWNVEVINKTILYYYSFKTNVRHNRKVVFFVSSVDNSMIRVQANYC